MTFRIEAADSPMSDFLEIVRDPTGSPVAMYSEMIVLRIFSYRLSANAIVQPRTGTSRLLPETH